MLSNEPKFNTLLPKIFLGALALFVIAYLIYKTVVITNSEIKYTIATSISFESNSKMLGLKLEYTDGQSVFLENCFFKDCRYNREIGKKFLILFYEDDPTIYEILKVVKQSEMAPKEPWSKIPEHLE